MSGNGLQFAVTGFVRLIPTRWLALLLLLGVLDLCTTFYWHSKGMMTELNPIMRPLLERSEWLFVVVKGLTLVAVWLAVASYAKVNLQFCRRVSALGALAYLGLWLSWTGFGNLS